MVKVEELLKKLITGVYGDDIKQMGADEFLESLKDEADLTDGEVEYLRPIIEVEEGSY